MDGRTSPVHRRDVPRQDLNKLSRVTHTREGPVDTFTKSPLPVRGVEWEPASVKVDTHDRPHGATNLRPAGAPVAELLEPPSSAHARADKLISTVPLLDALNPACTAGSAL